MIVDGAAARRDAVAGVGKPVRAIAPGAGREDRAEILDGGEEIDIDAVTVAVVDAVGAAAIRNAGRMAVDVGAGREAAGSRAVVDHRRAAVGPDTGPVAAGDDAAMRGIAVEDGDVRAETRRDAVAVGRDRTAEVVEVAHRAGRIIAELDAVDLAGIGGR